VIVARLLDLREFDGATAALPRVDARLAICDDQGDLVALGFEGSQLSVESDVERWTFDGPVVPLRRRRP
jgi:hypothetical protein